MFVMQMDIIVLKFLIMNHFSNQNTFFQKTNTRNIEFEILGMEEQFRKEQEEEQELNLEDVISYVSIKFYEFFTFMWRIVKKIILFIFNFLKKNEDSPMMSIGLVGIIFYFVFSGMFNAVTVDSEPAVILDAKQEIQEKSTKPSLTALKLDKSGMSISSTPIPSPKEKQRDSKVDAYIKRFEKVAVNEMEKFGIPASIKMAQALLETNIGNSKLCLKNNNHFGIKCFSKVCSNGHCSNMSDDHHKDFFRKYGSSWESWRDHSKFLNNDRYLHLQEYGTNYKKWAKGLQAAGYATDKNYSKKLIKLIEKYRLYELDDFKLS